MVLEAEAEHVIGLPLEPVRGPPQVAHRRDRLAVRHPHLDDEALLQLQGVEEVDHLEPGVAAVAVNGEKVRHHGVAQRFVRFQEKEDVPQDVLAGDDRGDGRRPARRRGRRRTCR